MPRKIGTPAKRQARDNDKVRIHSHMRESWLNQIDKAAEKEGVSRSNFIAGAAITAAMAVLGKRVKG